MKKIQFIIREYDALRVIVTLLVIIGHCTYYILGAPNEGKGYTAIIVPGLSGFYLKIEWITDIIYLFHMPLYMALSGALLKHKEIFEGGGINHLSSL